MRVETFPAVSSLNFSSKRGIPSLELYLGFNISICQANSLTLPTSKKNITFPGNPSRQRKGTFSHPFPAKLFCIPKNCKISFMNHHPHEGGRERRPTRSKGNGRREGGGIIINMRARARKRLLHAPSIHQSLHPSWGRVNRTSARMHRPLVRHSLNLPALPSVCCHWIPHPLKFTHTTYQRFYLSLGYPFPQSGHHM